MGIISLQEYCPRTAVCNFVSLCLNFAPASASASVMHVHLRSGHRCALLYFPDVNAGEQKDIAQAEEGETKHQDEVRNLLDESIARCLAALELGPDADAQVSCISAFKPPDCKMQSKQSIALHCYCPYHAVCTTACLSAVSPALSLSKLQLYTVGL